MQHGQHLFANWRDIEELMKFLLDLLQGCYKDFKGPPIKFVIGQPFTLNIGPTYVSLKNMILIVMC